MRQDYSRERNRWDRISGERDAAMKAPASEWAGWDFYEAGYGRMLNGKGGQKDIEQPEQREKGATKRRDRLVGKAAKRARRQERVEATLRQVEEELEDVHKTEQYGEWGGF